MNDNSNFDDEVNAPAEPEEVSPADEFPWPPREDESVVEAFANTWVEVMFRPTRFYRAMPEKASIKPALLYAMILQVLSYALLMFWSNVLSGSSNVADMTPQELAQHPFLMVGNMMHVSFAMFLLSPLITVVSLLFSACLIQVILFMLVKERGPLERTFRMVCFSKSPAVFSLIPFAGPFVGGIWALVLQIIGIREVHRTTTGRAAATRLLPCGCLMLLGILLAIVIGVVGVGMASKMGGM